MTRYAIMILTAFLAACGANTAGIPCRTARDCPVGQVCDPHVSQCYVAAPDAGSPEAPFGARSPDADPIASDALPLRRDASVSVDTVAVDAMAPDASPPDAMAPDLPPPAACAETCARDGAPSATWCMYGYCSLTPKCPNISSPPCHSCASDSDCCAGKCVSDPYAGGAFECMFTAGQPCWDTYWCASHKCVGVTASAPGYCE